MAWPTRITLLVLLLVIFVNLGQSRRVGTKSETQTAKQYSYPYVEKYFNQVKDHFNFETTGAKTFKQRYFYTDNYFKEGGPIFFYTGNEGAIEAFFNNTGFIFDIAPEFGALIIFAEHRYYGNSLPFGTSSFTLGNLGFLTIEQALADYAALITWLKTNPLFKNSPVITFGGSYGGLLSAYMRFKYPHLVAGALAASAPVLSTSSESSNEYFWQAVTKDFHDVDERCPDIVRAGFIKINELVDQGASGLTTVSETFKLCKTLASQDEVRHLMGWIRNSFTYQAMMDYPYSTSFMGSLPANPVNVSCGYLLNASSAMEGLAKAAALYYNSSQPTKCFDIFTEFIECADPTGCGLGAASTAWDYQACTEITLPAGSNNVTDMFPNLPFTQKMRADYCLLKYDVTPRTDWLTIQGFGKGLTTSSRIMFSNGLLDPWRLGGITESVSESIVALTIAGGAHHLDLRGSNPKDPESVVEIRNEEKQYIKNWLTQWREEN